ncbi:hypothetical protein D3C73_1231440 [compost metagenome]
MTGYRKRVKIVEDMVAVQPHVVVLDRVRLLSVYEFIVAFRIQSQVSASGFHIQRLLEHNSDLLAGFDLRRHFEIAVGRSLSNLSIVLLQQIARIGKEQVAA